MDLREVRYVAIYLRKSRGDEDTAMEKHRLELTEMAKRYEWKFDIYEEIGNAESMDWRPEVRGLLALVKDRIYDAVLVMDLDRFSRGDAVEQAGWRKVFQESETYVITPTKVYDLSKDDESLLAEVQGIFARYEYKMITKRLRQGKRIGAKMGRWTNGPPPIPYEYDRVERRLVVNPEKMAVYNLIKERVLEGLPLFRISTELNGRGIRSPKGGSWVPTTIHRLVTSEVHLGKIVQGKTSGSAHRDRRVNPLRKKPREEWLIVEGNHEAVKTPQEHLRILDILQRRRITPRRARSGAQVLSGLMRCGLCGFSLQFIVKPDRVEVKTCQHFDAKTGIRCRNRGCNVTVIHRYLDAYLNRWEAQLDFSQSEGGTRRAEYEVQLQSLRAELRMLEDGIERIHDLYIMNRIAKQELQDRLQRQDDRIRCVRDEIHHLTELLAAEGPSPKERLQEVREAAAIFNSATAGNADKNRALKKLFSRIMYARVKNDISIQAVIL